MTKVGEMVMVADLDKRDDLHFISGSQDTEPLRGYVQDASEYDSFFVTIVDGDYGEVYGMYGIVPYMDKFAERLR